MLNHDLVLRALELLGSKIFPEDKKQNELAATLWHDIARDEQFAQRVHDSKSSFLLPSWQGDLTATFPIARELAEYTVLAFDGSQIYPDRHVAGVGCFLINVGGCVVRYGADAQVWFFSEPKIFLPEQLAAEDGPFPFSADLIDLKREAMEFTAAYEKAVIELELAPYANYPLVTLFDGSLIFWHLEGKQNEVRDLFLQQYLDALELFYQKKIPLAGYISLPKSKELVNLIKIGLCRFTTANCIPCHANYSTFPCKVVDQVLDTQLCDYFLEPYFRTTIFMSNSKIVASYPPHLRPCFFYLHVGSEIVRVEVPQWIVQEVGMLDRVCKVVLDQATKGNGYPVTLAEAHEQAVVKGVDREFFYHLIYKKGLEQRRRIFISQKNIKKRGIGI